MTGEKSNDFAGRTARGAAVMLLARGFGTAISVAAMAVIARFVSPEEFGVVAMVIAILGIARVLEEFGLGDAAIQAERITEGQVTSLAIVNVVAGVLLAAGFMACGPLLVDFYDRPELLPICFALAPLFIFAGLGSQPRAMMRRGFHFRALAIAQAVSLAVAALTGMIAAIAGLGAWAIVLQHLAGAAALTVASWIASGWRPCRPAPLAAIRPLLGYGMNLGASQFINALTRNIDDILIGRWVGPAALGAYGRAFQLMSLPSTQLNQPLSSAVVPALSRLQRDPDRYRRLYRSSVEVIASLAFPLAVFTGVAAPAMVGILLGPDWSESVPLLRALTPAGLIVSMNVATGWVYLSLGRTDRQLRWRLVGSAAAIAGMVVGLQWGALGVAIGLSSARVVMRIPAMIYCFHGTPLRLLDVGEVIWRSVLASVAGGLAAWCFDPETLADGFRLLIQFGIFAVTWLIGMVVIPGGIGRLQAGVGLVRGLRSGEVDDAT